MEEINSVTFLNAYTEYEPVAKGLARKFIFAGRINWDGRSQEDYIQELRLQAVYAANWFQKTRGFCQNQERYFVYRALMNKIVSWARSASKEKSARESFKPINKNYDAEKQYEVRDQLNHIFKSMPKNDKHFCVTHFLTESVKIGGSYANSRKYKSRRLKRIRERIQAQ